MKSPSILLLTHLFPNSANPKLGTFLRSKALALKSAGADVTVVAPVPMVPFPLRHVTRYRDRYVPESRSRQAGIEVCHPRFFRPPGAWFRPYEGVSMHRSGRKLLRQLHHQHRFDAVIGGMLTNDGYAALLAGNELDVPAYSFAIGADIHTFPVGRPQIRRLNERLIGSLGAVFAVGPHFTEQIRKSYAGLQDKIHCNPFGVDVTLFRPGSPHEEGPWKENLGLRKETQVVLFVGDLQGAKGVPEILELIPRLDDLDVAFVLVGKGPLLGPIQSAIHDHRPGFAKCRVFPYLELGDLVRFYQNADLFLFPSHFEGSPTVLMEAIACGLPVIASDIPPHHDTIREGENGWFFPVGDVGTMETRVREFFSNDSWPAQRESSRQIAVRFFDSLENARSLLAFLQPGWESRQQRREETINLATGENDDQDSM